MKKLLSAALLVFALFLLTGQRVGWMWGDHVPPHMHTATFYLADSDPDADEYIATSDATTSQSITKQHIYAIPIDVSLEGYNSVAIWKITTHYSDGSYFSAGDEREYCVARVENITLEETTAACVVHDDEGVNWASANWDGTSSPVIISDAEFGLSLKVESETNTPTEGYAAFAVVYSGWNE